MPSPEPLERDNGCVSDLLLMTVQWLGPVGHGFEGWSGSRITDTVQRCHDLDEDGGVLFEL